MSWITERPGGADLAIRLIPRASRNQVDGLHGDALKIRLQAPPVEGKANKALIAFLSDLLGLPASRISIVGGASQRNKRVHLEGITAERVCAVLSLQP